jgi:MFS family permease
MLSWLSPDGKLILLTTTLRSFAVGFVSVLLGLYLAETGFDAGKVGALLAAVLAGNTLATTVASLFADSFGRRKSFIALSCLTIVGGILFPLTDSFILLMVIGAFAGFGLGGKDRAAQSALEQPVLSQAAPAASRTSLFAYYNMIGGLAAGVGALFSSFPVVLDKAFGIEIIDTFKAMFFVYAGVGIAVTLIYTRLSSAVEASPTDKPVRGITWPRQSKAIVFKLSALGGMDSFGGGFMLQTFLAYWFTVRFDLPLESLAGVFFAANLLSSFSSILAVHIARRIGLINTMVFTHIPANLLVLGVAFSPFAWLAIVFLLLRECFSQMDVPTRQSYTMAVVPPEERTAAAGMTTLGRQGGQMIAPYIAGQLVVSSFLSAPLVIGSTIKVAYDLLVYAQFRNIKPPEEAERSAPAKASENPS